MSDHSRKPEDTSPLGTATQPNSAVVGCVVYAAPNMRAVAALSPRIALCCGLQLMIDATAI